MLSWRPLTRLSLAQSNAVLTVTIAVGIADGPASAAKQFRLPTANSAAGQPRERGASLATAAERATTSVGLAHAGLLISTIDIRAAPVAAATLFAMAALAATTAGCRRSSHIATQCANGRQREHLRDGAAFLLYDMSLRSIVAMMAVSTCSIFSGRTPAPPWVGRNLDRGAVLAYA